MEKNFLVESKSFTFSVVGGASKLRVEEKRKNFLGVILLNAQSSEWLASMMEELLGLPAEQELVKSFREGSKVLIARRGGNKAGRFLEVSTFGLGGRKGYIVIPEGRRGWGWLKFSDELRKVVVFFSASSGGELGSSSTSEKKFVEDDRPTLGLAPKWMGTSFAEILRSDPTTVAETMPIAGDGRSWLRISLATPCEIDLLPAVQHTEADPRSAVDCFSLEQNTLDLLVKDQLGSPQGKGLKFEKVRTRTWRKLGPGFCLVLGRAVRRVLTRYAGSGLFRKFLGCRVARFMRKPNVSGPPPTSPVTTTEVSSGLVLNRIPNGGSEDTALGAKKGASPGSTGFVGVSPRPEPPSVADDGFISGTESPSGGESSRSQVIPAVSSWNPASHLFGFPPSPAPDLGFPAATTVSFNFTPLGKLQIPKSLPVTPSIAGADILGEKLRSPLPMAVSLPFQCYYRRAKKLREKHSVKWTDELISDSLEAVKMSVGYVDKSVTGAEPPAEKATKPRATKKSVTQVNQGFFRKGFLNLPPIPVPSVELQEVNKGDHNGEIVVWEEEEDDYWDGLPLDWAMDGDIGEGALAVREAMEEEFQVFARQKYKGKRELLNLQSSINYGDANYPSRRRKAGGRICQGSDMGSELSNLVSVPDPDLVTESSHFPLPVSSLASSEAGRGTENSAVGSQVSIEMGSTEGRILPSSSLEEPTSKPLCKGRKPKLSHLELSMACSSYFGEKGDRTMAFLSALDEEHRRWDMIEDCEL